MLNIIANTISGNKTRDAVAPTVVVTSNAVQPVAVGTFTVTVTFSEPVINFVVGDITISGGALSAFGTSNNIVFTATVTPTYTSNLSINIGAGVCTDPAGNPNLASNTLTVVASFAIGAVHSDDFNSTSLGAYTQNGATMTAATGDLVLSGGAGAFAQYLLLNTPSTVSAFGTHCLEKWKVQAVFTCPATGAFGFGVGIRSNNGPEQFDNIIRIAFDTAQEASRGTVYYYSSQNHADPTGSQVVATIGSQLMTAGTDYMFEVERNKEVITARLRSADGSSLLKTYTAITYNQTTTNTRRVHNRGQFGIWNFAGTITVKNYIITSNVLKNPAIMYLTDSNGSLYAGADTARSIELVATALGRSFEAMWGINAEIPDVTAIIPAALVLAHPTYTKMAVDISSNDKANGVSDATRRTRYATMISTLNTGSFNTANLFLGIPVARNGQDIALIKTDTDTTYSTYIRWDGYTATKDPVSTNLLAANNSGDNIHLSTAGHAARATVMQTALT